jgi:hypothetical protein
MTLVDARWLRVVSGTKIAVIGEKVGSNQLFHRS